MKITCPSCSARYSIDDAKVKGKAFKFTCKKCGQTHVYRGTADGAATAVPAAAPAAAPAEAAAPPQAAPGGGEEEAVWYVAVGEEQQGPYTTQQIRDYIQSDQLDPESFMWKEGMEDWLPVQQMQEFADFYQGGAPPAAAPAPQQPSPFGGLPEDVTVASPFAAAAPPPGDAGDLFAFGGASGAAKAAAKAADPSPFGAFGGGGGGAAAVASRGGADLFGSSAQASPFEGGGEEREEDVMMGAASAAPSPRVDARQMIGQRNENSVLFSLSSLQALGAGRSAAGAGAQPAVVAPAKAGMASGEGSGLIDIRAMAGSAARPEERHDDMFSMGGGGAIGAPVAVPILTRPIRHADESKRPMFILMGIIGAFAIAIVVLLIFLLGGNKEKVVVQQVAVTPDGGSTVVAATTGTDADAGAREEEPDGAAAKADEDKGGAGDVGATGDVPPTGDGDPNAKAADGGEGGAPTGNDDPGGHRRDAGRRTEGQDAGGTGPATTGGRDSGTTTQRDTGRVAGDLENILGAGRRDAGGSSAQTSGLPATPDRNDVRSKFESVRGAVRACTGNQAGTASVATTIQGSSGRVTRVNVTGDFTGPAATCIGNAIRGLTFPQFSNPTLTVNYSYRF